jgi:hypothetical protein
LPTFISDNQFTQYDAGVDLSWAIGGNAELLGNIAYTKRELPNVPNRDFSGPTGNLRLNWRLTGKTGLNAGLFRGIGAVEDITRTIVTDSVRWHLPVRHAEGTPRCVTDTSAATTRATRG